MLFRSSINNRKELNKNNKILKVSNNIGRERGREEGKGNNITKHDSGSFYLYEDTTAYLSGLKVVFEDYQSSSSLILENRYLFILFIFYLKTFLILKSSLSYFFLIFFLFFLFLF